MRAASVMPRETPAPAQAAPEQSEQEFMTADIQAILKDVKLPERRAAKGAADKKAPQPEMAPPPIEKKKTIPSLPAQTSPVVPLRTLKDDINDVIRVNKVSMVKAAAMEQDRATESEPLVKPHRRGSWGIIAGILFFLFLGSSALLGVVYVNEARHTSITVADEDSMVFAEQTATININGVNPLGLKTQLASVRGRTSMAVGSILRIKPMVADSVLNQTRPATAAEFLKAIGTQAPDELLRALDDQFFFGFHTSDRNAPVMVFTIRSYDHAFPAMLQWEKSMNSDLSPIFTAVAPMARDENGAPASRLFSDLVMRNYDVRALKDDNGNIILYYSFPNPRLLIVAESQYSFVELLSRLQAQRVL